MNPKYHYDNNYALSPRVFNDVYLFQLGEMMCDTGTVMFPHVHLDWFEITYVLSGKGQVSTNNKATKVLEKGDFYFSHPKEIHMISSDPSDPLRYFFFAFNFDSQSKLAPLLEECKQITLSEDNRKFHSSSLAHHFNNLLSEIQSDSNIGTLIFEHEIKLVLMKIFQIIKSEKIENYHIPQNNSSQILCFNVLNYIDSNFTTMDNAACLSNVFGYNYSYISRCFKKIIGTSISNYIIDKKLNLAKEMLEKDSVTVTDVADALNYSSIYAFSRAFKARYGMSPSEYRQTFAKSATPVPPFDLTP